MSDTNSGHFDEYGLPCYLDMQAHWPPRKLVDDDRRADSGDCAAQALASMNQWLTVNQRWVNFVVLLLFGLLLLINGLATLHVIGG